MRRFLCSLAVFTVVGLVSQDLANAQSTDQPSNEIEVRGLLSVPTGDASFSTTGTAGSIISFDRDVEFRNEFGYELRFTHKSENRKHKFMVDFVDQDWERSRSLTRSFTFLGETYLANLDTTSNLRLRTFKAMYSYRWGNEKFRFGPMGDVGVVSARLEITGTTNNGVRTREGSITKLAGTVGYDLDYDPTPKVNIFHNLGGIVFQGEHLFHSEGGLKYFVANSVGITGGYRIERYKLEDGSNFITVRKHGPFFGAVFRF
jgi:hypothetical protein